MIHPRTSIVDLPPEILVEIGKILADQQKLASLAALRASFPGGEVVVPTLFEAVSWSSNARKMTVDGRERRRLDTFEAVFRRNLGRQPAPAIEAIRCLRIDTTISKGKAHLIKYLARHCQNVTSLTYHHTTTTPHYNLSHILHPIILFRNLTHLDLNFMPLPGFGFANFCQKIVNMQLKNLKSLTLEYVWQANAMKKVVKLVTVGDTGGKKGRETYWNDLRDDDDLPMQAFNGERAYVRMLNEGEGFPVLDKFSIFARMDDIEGCLQQLPFEAKTIMVNCIPVSGEESRMRDLLELFESLRTFSSLRHLIVVLPVTTINFGNNNCVQPQDWYSDRTILDYSDKAKRTIPLLKTVELALKIHPRLLASSSPFPPPSPVVCDALARWYEPFAAHSRRWDSRQSFMSGNKILCTIRVRWTSSGQRKVHKINYDEYKTFRKHLKLNARFEDIPSDLDDENIDTYISITEREHKDTAPNFAPFDLMQSVMSARISGHMLQAGLFGMGEGSLFQQIMFQTLIYGGLED